jgi:prepilin-type N-terminal cleavage/methylation domain-containing protein
MYMRGNTAGFTLIELSIVLVIIGLIVGGVLVGQDLIRAAEIRATISQIEKYNTAVNTFRGKYNAIPGDLNSATATTFGFTARGSNAGEGDGNGVIEGITSNASGVNNGYLQGGETTTFWVDLSVGNPSTPMNINLIDGSFTQAAPSGGFTVASGSQASYWPAAKLGRGNYVYVWSSNGTNYFGLAPITSVAAGVPTMGSASMTIQQAYQIDKKVDDGYPATGSVMAVWGGNTAGTAIAANTAVPTAGTNTVNGVANASLSSTSCYDSTNNVYALSYGGNNGAGATCAISFRFQ